MENSNSNSVKQAFITVFILSLYTIVLELILSRMAAFYLNYSNSFLAIPMTLFGLAVGSLHVHLSKKDISDFKLEFNLWGLNISSFSAFILIFFLFSRHFPFIGIQHLYQIDFMTTVKTFVFAIAFITTFYFIGKSFTIIFTQNKNIIGRIYGADLFGAAVGCCLAPLLFHFVDLPYILMLCFLLVSFYTLYYLKKLNLKNILINAGINLIVLFIMLFLESNYDMSKTVYHWYRDAEVREVVHKWNEYSRVSLLEIDNKGKMEYRIIHDNAESNVGVIPFKPDSKKSYVNNPKNNFMIIPFLLNRKSDDILCMFAGCGKQMIEYYDYTAGEADITGVEINPLCKKFALKANELGNYGFQEFYDKPNVNLVIQEGRSFLDNDKNKYDIVYVGSDAATFVIKTGHSRKYLDTYEAMSSYLDHLKDDGLILFHAQPSVYKIESIKKYFQENNLPDFEKCIVLFSRTLDRGDSLLVSKKPFTKEETDIINEYFTERKYYIPGKVNNFNQWFVDNTLMSPVKKGRHLVSDDRPFIRMIDYKNFRLFPELYQLRDPAYYKSWINIITLIVIFITLSGIIISLYFTRAKMPSPNMLVYLLITGFCYMMCEITYIAKLELFLGNPLLSMALLLFIFLLSNSIGSWFFDRVQNKLNMNLLPIFVAIIIFLTLMIMNFVVKLVSLPLLIKIVITVILIFPSAICLGLFYPYVVTYLNKNKQETAIPITYCISTLSSVVGATYAMTMIINFGYTIVLYQTIGGYVLLTLFALVYNLFRKQSIS